ncbi:MAG: linear amide C-N hydrolase [Ferruginibacter sp.]
MNKYIVLFALLFFTAFHRLTACTTFFINKNGQLVFGRNYDWVSAAGMVCTNLAGLNKTSLKVTGSNTIAWVSKYGSITFNQYGKEFPTGGMNEKGLVVELMWADGSKYPEPDKRPVMGVLQWIQYQLDNNQTIEEVIATDAVIRISPNDPPLHYLIADTGGNVATVEFINGKLIVHTGKDLPFPVLTNNPYSQSEKAATGVNILSGNTRFSFQDNSLQRFAKACSMIQQYRQNDNHMPVIDYAFDILDKVSQEGFTKWSIVYDVKGKKIYFKTAVYSGIKSVNFKSFDFACPAKAGAIDINIDNKGDVGAHFGPFDDTQNRLIVEKAVEESKSQVPMSDNEMAAIINYAKAIKCKQ